MKIGVIADDFTGASDIALTLAEGGMRTAQFVGIPTTPLDVDAAVVSLKSRTIPAQDAINQSLAACEWLRAQGAEQIIYKVCSTFDSTDAGNIGQVTQALAAHLGVKHVMVCPAFPANGRSVYMGHLFVGDTLLHESGMQNHPLTPMTDPDLRRVLGRQTAWPVGHIDHATVQKGPEAMRAALPNDHAMMIVDAVTDDDLRTLAVAARSEQLLTGGSGIAIGLPANFGAQPAQPEWENVDGPGVVLSGSCSTATRAQIAHYQEVGPAMAVSPDDLMIGQATAESVAEWVMGQNAAPLVYTSSAPEIVKRAQDEYGQQIIAEKIEGFFCDLASQLASAGVKRMVVAGGETSGAVVSGLNAQHMIIGPKLANGVPALRHGDMALALKSGNFGGPDFFETALARMGKAA